MPSIIPTITLKTNVKIPKGPDPHLQVYDIFFIPGINILFICAKNDGKNNYTLKLIFNDQ